MPPRKKKGKAEEEVPLTARTQCKNAMASEVQKFFAMEQSAAFNRIENMKAATAADSSSIDSIDPVTGLPPLHIAAKNSALEAVKNLVEAKADVAQKSTRGLTALHHASIQGNTDIADYLIANEANVNEQDDSKNTPLHIAARMGFYQLTLNLIAAKGDQQVKNKSGATPYLSAATTNQLLMVQYYLGKAKDVIAKIEDINQVDSKGNTALHIAASLGYKKIIKFLMEEKADTTIKNAAGQTPLDEATPDILALLKA